MSDELKELQRRLIEDIKDNEPSPEADEFEADKFDRGEAEGIIDGIKVALYEIAHLSDEYQDFNNKS